MDKIKNGASTKGQQNLSGAKSNSMNGNQSSKTKSSISDSKERGPGTRSASTQLKK